MDLRWLLMESEFQAKMNDINVPYQPCTTITVNILRGRDMSINYVHDMVADPSTHASVTCSDAIGQSSFYTKVSRSTRSPEWNETFTFVLPHGVDDAKIEIAVFGFSLLARNVPFGNSIYDTSELKFGDCTPFTLDLEKHGQLDLEIQKRWRSSPDCRLSLGLSEQEIDYREKRKPITMKALQELLGDDGPKSLQETPTIAVAVSGGGYRAMIGSCGAMEAFSENGLLDSIMYMTGLSGSSWYISSSYHHQSLHDHKKMTDHHDWLRTRMKRNLTSCGLDASFLNRFRKLRNYKSENNQLTTFVDFYGLSLGEAFLGGKSPTATLSSFQSYVESAKVPFPIISCAHVKEKLPMSAFSDIVEVTPFEISLPEYGINIPAEMSDSIWCNGILQKQLPEPALHFLMGASSSAFAILVSKISSQGEIAKNLSNLINWYHRCMEENNSTSEEEDAFTTPPSSPSDSDTLHALEDYDNRKLIRRMPRRRTNFSSESSCEAFPRNSNDHDHDQTEDFLGRSFLVPRTANVNSFACQYLKLQKYLFNAKPVTESHAKEYARTRARVSVRKNTMMLCDAGIGCNLSAIHLLRPQRKVDILIIVDMSQTLTDDKLSMESFVTLQNQLAEHGIRFPRISIKKISGDPFREVYLLEDKIDPDCPVVLWFTFANKRFKELENPPRRPGYPSPDPADTGKVKFNDFVLSASNPDYATFQLSYTPLNFDRLRELMKFNISSNMSLIKDKISKKVQQLREKF